MKLFISIVIMPLILCVSVLSSYGFAQEKISIGAHDYPPYYNARAKGMMTDVYQAVFNRVGVDAVIRTFPIKRGIAYLFENKIDAFSPGHILLSPELKKKADWENSFIVAMVMIYYAPNLKGKFVYNSLEDLRGRRLAILVNSPYISLYKKHGIKIYEAQTPQMMIRMVKAGHVDFFVNTLLSGQMLIKTEFPDDANDFNYFVWNTLACSLAVNKANPDSQKWLGLFRQGLAQIKKDGTYIRIFERYWGKNNIPKAVLFPELVSFGVDHVNAQAFNQPLRNEWGRIISK